MTGSRRADPRADSARHRAVRHRVERGERSVRPVFVVLLVVLAMVVGAGASYALVGRGDDAAPQSAGACPGPSITVAASPEIAPALRTAVADAGCEQIQVDAVASAAASARVAAGKDVPDVWIPDSSRWVQQAAGAAPTTPQQLLDSVATSPVVLVAGSGKAPTTWSAALAAESLVLGDPLTSTSAGVPLVAGAGETGASGAEAAAALVPLAQAQAGRSRDRSDDAARLTAIAESGGVTAVSEQAWLAHAPDLSATVPEAGTLALDYPVMLTTGEDRRADIDQTTRQLVRVLSDDATLDAVAAADFRVPDRALPADGAGKVTLQRVGFYRVSAALRQWAALALPSRTLAVVDVSGSMDFDAGGETRMQLTIAATGGGLSLFPDAAAIGLWAFSQRLDGDLDHRELLPIRRLDAETPEGTQRESLAGSLTQLPAMTGGSTGLYDTTLAAYEEVLSDYDPQASNSVLLFTDGANEDPGSISLPELIAKLRDLADPERPVRIIAIGISGDADSEALRTIAQATGGQSYLAQDPADMPTVFAEALGSRTST